MFEQVKKHVNLLEQIANDTQQSIVECGTNTYRFEEDEPGSDVGCSFCGHHQCLKFFYNEDEPEKAGYHCFSCSEHGSVIDWVSKRESISLAEAAKKLAKEHDVKIPSNYNPIAEVFGLAAKYYQNCLLETCNVPYMELARMTPMQYQVEVRKHSPEVIQGMEVGWSDGGLVRYLEGVGIEDDVIEASGLKSAKTGRDFLPSRVFIYPHYVKGQVSSFTFKDALKKLAYQLPNKYTLNGYEFWGQDTISTSDTVFIVEGQNDRISLCEALNFKDGVLATIGQISGSQLDWMRENLSDKHVITLFDPDAAGDKYRAKVEKIGRCFKSLTQVTPQGDDIDKLLCDGVKLEEILPPVIAPLNVRIEDRMAAIAELGDNQEEITKLKEEQKEDEEGSRDIEANSIVKKKNCYWKIVFKEGEPTYVKISDFIIILKNIYITEGGDRHREIVIIREDGYTSTPVLVDSESKVSAKNFKVLLAKAADATFKGSEQDLSGMWDLIYSTSSETQVRVTRTVGRHENMKCWIFRNKLITDSGASIDPDKDGVFWLSGKTVGIRPESLNVTSNVPSSSSNGDNKTDIPFIEPNVSKEESEELMKELVFNLSKNLNNPGKALILLGWVYSCVHSNTIFSLNHSFPFLFFWGTKGNGKTSIIKWLQDFFDMRDSGYTSIPQLKSAVGWGRKIEYYSSLPVFIDEIRGDRETEEYISLFRTYYDRTPRTMGVRDGFGVKVQEVRSCFIFAGEDQFDDPAARERCIPVRIPVHNRELVESFKWMEDNRHLFSGITFQWILEASSINPDELKAEIRSLDRELVDKARCSQRTSKNWASMGVFAQKLCDKYLPNYDFKKYLFETSTLEARIQRQDTTVLQFFELVEALQVGDNSRITSDHIITEGKLVHIWFPAVFKVVMDDSRGRFPFSKNAVLSAIREEPYFHSEDKKIKMGLNGTRRVVLTLDLTNAPDTVLNIAKAND